MSEAKRIKFRGRVGEDITVAIDYGPKSYELYTSEPIYSPTDICTVRFGCEEGSITAEILREDFEKVIDYAYKDIHNIKEG